MSNYSLFSRFEDALGGFHRILEEASAHYKMLFEYLMQGRDIHKTLVDDTYYFRIQQARFVLHEEQQRVSRVLSKEGTFLTISEIQTQAKHRLTVDAVSIGKECIALYAEIERYVNNFEEYFGSKVDEYKSFLDGVYKDHKSNNLYTKDGSSNNNKQGVLIHTSA